MDSGAFANIASHSHKVDIIEPSSSNVRIQKVKIGGGESHPICGTSILCEDTKQSNKIEKS